MTINKALGGFKTLWLRYEENSSDRNQLFIKAHTDKKYSKYPKDRTLFVINIPPYATEESVKFAFGKKCGPVESVQFVKNKSEKCTYVIFEKDSSLDKALSLTSNVILTLSSKEKPLMTGLNKWCREYNNSVCNEGEAKKYIQQFMENYDAKVTERLIKEKEDEEGDADGWVKVTGRKKRGEFALARKESTINKLQEKLSTGNQKKQLKNFYPFQIREAKRQNLMELRKKFDLDKQKLQQMKQNRTFKPF